MLLNKAYPDSSNVWSDSSGTLNIDSNVTFCGGSINGYDVATELQDLKLRLALLESKPTHLVKDAMFDLRNKVRNFSVQ